MNAILLVHPVPKNIKKIHPFQPDDLVVAVDSALVEAMNQHLRVDVLIGDFDSLSGSDVDAFDGQVVKLDTVKDITDTEAAVKYVIDQGVEYITVLGGFGGSRVEHFIANMNLVSRYDVMMKNENTIMYKLNSGKYSIKKSDYHYLSIFALTPIEGLDLNGVKYPLDNHFLPMFDSLCISNEITSDAAKIAFDEGSLLIIESNEDKRL